MGRHKKHKAARERSSAGGESPGGVRGGVQQLWGCAQAKGSQHTKAAGAAAGSLAPCLPSNSSAERENDKEGKFSCLCAPSA